MEDNSTAPSAKTLLIDDAQLDKEWIRQPVLVFKYSKISAQLRQDFDSLKTQMELLKAKTEQAVRKAPIEYGVAKVTESAIASAVSLHPSVVEMQEALSKARYQHDLALGMLNALEHKRRALENLVSLHGQQYFAAPSTTRAGGAEAVDTLREKTKERIRRKQ